MTVGFEEDSPFYDGPVIDTREDVKSEEKVEKAENVVVEENKESEVTEKVIIADKKESEVKEEAEAQKEVTQVPQENETTFSYERDDD